MKQFVNLLMMAMVGASVLNAYQFKFDNKYAVMITYGNGQQLKMNNLWTIEFADALPGTMKKTITAAEFLSKPWNGTVRGGMVNNGGAAEITYESELLSLTVKFEFGRGVNLTGEDPQKERFAVGRDLNISAVINRTSLPILKLTLPDGIDFGLDGLNRVVFPMRGAEGLGVAYKPSFFKEHKYPHCKYKTASSGPRGYEHVYGGPLKSLADREPVHPLKVTVEGRKWFTGEVIRSVEAQVMRVNRPPAEGQYDVSLIENECGSALSGSRFGGDGWLFRMGGNGNDSATGDYGAALFRTMVNGTMNALIYRDKAHFQEKKIGLVLLKNGPAHGSWTPGSPLDWQSFLDRAPFMAACKGKFIVLESADAMREALRGNDFAMILNPYGELFPSMKPENLFADLDLVKNYVKKGGVWWEVGGYSFYTVIVPEPYMAVSETYTSAVADFTYLDYGRDSIALMGIQPMMRQPWDKERLLKPCQLDLSGRENDCARYRHSWMMACEAGETWSSPVLRLSFNNHDVFSAMEEYALLNDIHGSLEAKVPKADVLDKLKNSLLIRLGGRNAAEQTEAMKALPVPSLVHYTEYLHGGFDKQYPDHLPVRESWGTNDDLKQFIMDGKAMGHLMMPYTNTSWWCIEPKGETFEREGDAPLLRLRNGATNLENYAGNKGYSLCFWHPAVQAAHRKVRRQMTEEFPSDVLFQDQVGARRWSWNYNKKEPLKASGLDGMHSLTMEDSAVVPMATEDGHDRVLNFETIICGCAWASVEAGGKRHGQHLRYRYPDGEWEFFPLLSFLGHDQCLFTTHDLGHFTETEERLAETLAFGYSLSYRWSLGSEKSVPRSNWLNWLDAIQKALCSQYAGKRLWKFRYLKGQAPDGVIYANYSGPVSLIVNLGPEPVSLTAEDLKETNFAEAEWVTKYRLCGYGFFGMAPKACVGYMEMSAETQEKAGFALYERDGKLQGSVYGAAGASIPIYMRPAWADKKQTVSVTDGKTAVAEWKRQDGDAWMLTLPKVTNPLAAMPPELEKQSPKSLGWNNKIAVLCVDGVSEEEEQGGLALIAALEKQLAGTGLEVIRIKKPQELLVMMAETDRSKWPFAVVNCGGESIFVPHGVSMSETIGTIKQYIEKGGIVWATGGYPFFIQRQQQADGTYKWQSVGGGNAAVLGFSCATTPVEDPSRPLTLTADGRKWFGEERSKRLEASRAGVQRSFVTTAYQEKLVMGGSDCFVGGIRCDGWGYFFSAGGFIPPRDVLSEIIAGTVIHLYDSPWSLPRESSSRRCWKLVE